MRIDSYPLLDAFLCAVAMYLAYLFVVRLQGNETFKNMPFYGHAVMVTIIWTFLTFCAVYNSEDKGTIILGTIIIVVGVIVIYLAFCTNVFQSFSKSADLTRMIRKYDGDYMNPQIVIELYQYCYNHEFLNPVVRRYNAKVGDFALIYLYLLSKCRVSGNGHFIPISTFFFAASLDYVLSKKNGLCSEDIFWLRKYFGLLR